MQARRYIEAPAARPLPYGLLSVALVNPDNDPHSQMGVQYEALGCGVAHATLDQCVADLEAFGGWTTDDGKVLVTGDAFTIYALNQCRAIGGGYADAKAVALAKLANGFERAVEEGHEREALASADDLTPTEGTPVSPLVGLAILEAYAAKNYGSVPVLHSPRDVTTVLAHDGVVDRYGARLETTQGVPVSSGGGYGTTTKLGPAPDDGDPDNRVEAAAGERWLRMTGTVVVRRGDAMASEPVLGRGDDNLPTNDVRTWATQPVTVTHECINAAVLVQAPEVALDGGAP